MNGWVLNLEHLRKPKKASKNMASRVREIRGLPYPERMVWRQINSKSGSKRKMARAVRCLLTKESFKREVIELPVIGLENMLPPLR